MTPVRPVYTFRIDEDLLVNMQALKERDGIPYSEQIRRGLKLFFQERRIGATSKAAKKPKAKR